MNLINKSKNENAIKTQTQEFEMSLKKLFFHGLYSFPDNNPIIKGKIINPKYGMDLWK